MVNIALTINSMENNTNNNAVFTYIMPFWDDKQAKPFNAIEEIEQLASEGTGGLLYRVDQEPSQDGEDKESSHFSKGKNNDQDNNKEIVSNFVFRTIPFKSCINCGVGYLALTNVILDSYFSYHQQFDQLTNKFRKVYQINNIVNMYYIIAMLQKVSATCIEKSVNNLHEEYINSLLSKKGINIDTYTNKAEISIHPKDIVQLITHVQDIDSLIAYQNNHALLAYLPLKPNAAECLLQLLLHIYILWKQDTITNMIDPLNDKMVLFLEIAQLNNELYNYELMHKEYETFIKQIREAYQNENMNQKYLVFNRFLKALDKYIHNLTVVPVSLEKNNRNLSSMHDVLKRKKAVTESDSFFVKHKKSAKNIALTILTITLLYRLIKKNSKNMKT